jgi:long-chain acyl-CoA synthetase
LLKLHSDIVLFIINQFFRYYQLEDKTKEDFYSEYGRHWFRSGDIGEMTDDGQLKIVDRKKDLVKLQFGEYISLGKVESVLKACPYVENICIYGDSFKSYCVALVTPDANKLKELAKKYNKEDLEFEAMCEDKDVTGGVLRDLVNYGKKLKLEKFEIPGAVTLIKDLWLPESGLVTAAFKLKRKPIQQEYQIHIDRMYGIPSRQNSKKDILNKV